MHNDNASRTSMMPIKLKTNSERFGKWSLAQIVNFDLRVPLAFCNMCWCLIVCRPVVITLSSKGPGPQAAMLTFWRGKLPNKVAHPAEQNSPPPHAPAVGWVCLYENLINVCESFPGPGIAPASYLFFVYSLRVSACKLIWGIAGVFRVGARKWFLGLAFCCITLWVPPYLVTCRSTRRPDNRCWANISNTCASKY